MNIMKRILSLWLAVFLICGLFLSSSGSVNASTVEGGLSFDFESYWATEEPLEITSNSFTVETWLCFPKTYLQDNRGGVIIGNYGAQKNIVSVEVYSGGVPRIFFTNSDGITSNYKFSSVNLYNGNWTHLAITCNGSSLKCYINGKLKETLEISLPSEITVDSPLAVGGDFRVNNAQYFKGNLKSVAVWSDVRTANEISKDMTNVSGQDLLAAYNFENLAKNVKRVENGVKNGTALEYVQTWFDDKEPVTDYDYSFAVIGDTQTVCYYTPDKFGKIYDFILDNVEEKKIKFVFGLGDITEKSTAAEWSLATENIRRMDGVVPYSVIRGNHDYKSNFNNYCPVNQYGFEVDGTYDETPLNTYRTFTVADIDYLFVTLDYGPSDDVLDWASEVIENYPKHNVIITTHAYLFHDGSTLEESDTSAGGWIPTNDGGDNNGDDIWEKLVSKHENIVLVMSGHEPSDDIVVSHSKGVNGNVVTQMLIDPQDTDRILGSSGLVAMFYFSNGGRHVTVEYYSSIRGKFFKRTNQFEMDIAVVGVSKDASISRPDNNTSSDGDNSSNNSNTSGGNNASVNNSNTGNSSSSNKGNYNTGFGDNSPVTDNNSFEENNDNTIGEGIINDSDNSTTDDGKNDTTETNSKENKIKKTNIVAIYLSILFLLIAIAVTTVLLIRLIRDKKKSKAYSA